MQTAFDFGAASALLKVRDRLRDHFGPLALPPQRTPMAQLVKSLISNKTYDRVSLAAYGRLEAAYEGWPAMAAAPASELETHIAQVRFADRKAAHLAATLGIVARERPDFDLVFLGAWPADAAFGWLERLPGVGRKVAASTLNFSTLQRPAFVIDSHVQRVLQRLGFVGR
ncbi:hypothetical protein [Phenylobacterium sp.]|uniref:endonuclease III domain-containing protein n=1 Tax=Phenylobacterium sp. TaxID=1871053 RepID=UPI00301D994E